MPEEQTSSTSPLADAHARGPAMTSDQAARLIMKSAERIRQLSKMGWIAYEGNGQERRYRLLDVVQGYIRFRDDEDRRSSKSAAQSRITDARSREVELRNAQREGKLIELEDAIASIESLCALVRQQLMGLPARVTRDLVVRRTIETAVNDILSKIADSANERASSLEARRDAVTAIQANGAGSVGSSEPDASAVVGGSGAA